MSSNMVKDGIKKQCHACAGLVIDPYSACYCLFWDKYCSEVDRKRLDFCSQFKPISHFLKHKK